MTRKEHLLLTLEEEALEVALALAQRCSKTLRFSPAEVQPGQPHTNAERVMHEFADLDAMIEMLQEEGVLPTLSTDNFRALKIAKKSKIEKNLEISRENGTLL
jgi:hypothetical protein